MWESRLHCLTIVRPGAGVDAGVVSQGSLCLSPA
jgi:hypothetical protein